MTNKNYTVQQLVEKFNTMQLSLENMHKGFSFFNTTTFAEFRDYFNLNANLSDIADNDTVSEVLDVCFNLIKDQFEHNQYNQYNQIGKINCWFD